MSYPKTERRQNADSDTYFNSQFNALPLMVDPGETIWSNKSDEMLIAHVGTGLVVSIFDRELKMGALAYVLLPTEVENAFPYFKTLNQSLLTKSLNPVDKAIEKMKRHGAGKNRIIVRLSGAAVFENQADAGMKHAVFVKEYLSRKGLKILNEDLGGPDIRRIHFFPDSGRMVRIYLKRQDDFTRLEGLENHFQENAPFCT